MFISITMIIVQGFVCLLAINKSIERLSLMWMLMAIAFLGMFARRCTAFLLIFYKSELSYLEPLLDQALLPQILLIKAKEMSRSLTPEEA